MSENADKTSENTDRPAQADSTSESSADTGAPDANPEQLQGAIEKLSQHKPEAVSEFMTMMGTGPVTNPLHRKMEGGHITQLLDLAADHDEREYELQKQAQDNASSDRAADRRYYFLAFLVIAVLFGLLLFLFQDQPDVLIPALTGRGGLVSGFLGGWGVGHRSA